MPRIVRLDLASLILPDWHPEAIHSPSCPVYGYAIDHPDGVILFDTGVGADNALIGEFYSPQVRPLDQALEALGIGAESVVAVVNSHLHFDHCGQNPMFYGTDVPFYVAGQELVTVERDPTYTIAEWAVAPEPQCRILDGDAAVAEGVTVLAAPGHTLGHQALLVESDDQRIVIAGQAVFHAQEFIDEVATDSNVSSPELQDVAVDTMRKLKALEPDRVLFAHCEHWAPEGEQGTICEPRS